MDNINVQKDTVLQLAEGWGETWPQLNIVLINLDGLLRIKVTAANLLELDFLKHGVEEYFHENEHISIILAYFLHPLDIDFIVLVIVGPRKLR